MSAWTAANERVHALTSNLSICTLLIVGAFDFRRVSAAVIRSASLQEVYDVFGNPQGHQQRVRLFAQLLGIATWLAGAEVGRALSLDRGPPNSWLTLAAVFGPMVGGWLVCKFVIWRMTPKTTRPLPAGGFEVITQGDAGTASL